MHRLEDVTSKEVCPELKLDAKLNPNATHSLLATGQHFVLLDSGRELLGIRHRLPFGHPPRKVHFARFF